MRLITVREFAKLTTAPGHSSLDRATVSAQDFAFLADLSQRADAPRLVRVDATNAVTVMNYVGVIRTPTGLEIEIMPKHVADDGDLREARRVVLRLIAHSIGISPRAADEANLEVLHRPFTDWLAAMFLRETARLLKKGLRQDYHRLESNERYLRGRLDVPRQLRAGPTAASRFNILHDVFIHDRAENRLIKTAVEQVYRETNVASTLQLAAELMHLLREVPNSTSITADLAQWGSDRLMAHYGPVREPCRLILTGQTPFSVAGQNNAQSMLFPMERLFEDYVARSVRASLSPDFNVRRQPRTYALCTFNENEWFDLRPDLVVSREGLTWILDAKWKLLNKSSGDRFGLSQADLYQLNAYGQNYLAGSGDLFLVYPRTADSPDIAAPLEMKPDLRIHIRFIDMISGHLDLTSLNTTTRVSGAERTSQIVTG